MELKRRMGAAMRAFTDPHLVPETETLGAMVDARVDTRLGDEVLQDAVKGAVEGKLGDLARAAASGQAALEADGTIWKSCTPRWDRVRNVAQQALAQADLTGGAMLEIGGRLNPRNADFTQFDYHALDLEDAPGADVPVMAGDITNCPHIPDHSFDFIFSFDVFEHIDKPWLAAAEIRRLLRPGGVTMHSTLFAWRYHPCPIDYWRYTAEGLKSLFSGLDCVHAEFDYTERRRDVRGQGKNAVTPDAFGGWRENVRVNYAGIKR